MFKRSEYKNKLAELNLTSVQKKKLKAVLESMMNLAGKKAIKARESKLAEFFFNGKASGINAIWHFVNGSLLEQDEFEDK